MIRKGQLLRVCGDLVSLEELHGLEAAGVRTYIDLRGPDEDRMRLMRWARRARVEYVSIPIGVAGGRDLMRRILVGGGGAAQGLALFRGVVGQQGTQPAPGVGAPAGGPPGGLRRAGRQGPPPGGAP